ncbi:hypothetical protein BU16DRAFT_118797 [Lophium mytilinum]|uniref:Uncharacterized protein n=1 Tax=Lophium mytilinum TaxID=390894 RepID=A0A6A6QG85_9PEZI|nr:hypothetical protein BU16DRAFT_118797 [Lophium mytilinum]
MPIWMGFLFPQGLIFQLAHELCVSNLILLSSHLPSHQLPCDVRPTPRLTTRRAGLATIAAQHHPKGKSFPSVSPPCPPSLQYTAP